MFGTLGGPELFLIFVVALIVFGPRKLPEIGKSLGRMMGEFRKASNEFRSTIESEVEAEKIREAMRIDPPRVEPAPSPSAAGTGTASPEPVEPVEPIEPAATAQPADEPSASAEPPAGPSASEASPREPVPETVSRQTDPTPIEPK